MFSFLTASKSLTIGYCLFGAASLMLALVSCIPHHRRVRLLAFAAWAVMSLLTMTYYIVWNLPGGGFNPSTPSHIQFGLEGAGVDDFFRLKVLRGVVFLLLLVGFFLYRRYIAQG